MPKLPLNAKIEFRTLLGSTPSVLNVAVIDIDTQNQIAVLSNLEDPQPKGKKADKAACDWTLIRTADRRRINLKELTLQQAEIKVRQIPHESLTVSERSSIIMQISAYGLCYFRGCESNRNGKTSYPILNGRMEAHPFMYRDACQIVELLIGDQPQLEMPGDFLVQSMIIDDATGVELLNIRHGTVVYLN